MFEIYDQNRLVRIRNLVSLTQTVFSFLFLFQTKDEFFGMFFVELNLNIPYETPEQPMLTRDYSLLKRRLK